MLEMNSTPESWKDFKLGELLQEVKVKYRNLSERENIPVLSMTRHKGLILQEEKFDKRVAGRDIRNYKVIRKNQIAYGFPMEEGVIYALTKYEAGLISPTYYVWDLISKDVDIKFLDYFLKIPSMINTYERLTSKTVQRRRLVKPIDFENIEIKVPPLSEQKAIAHILSTVQRAKEATEQVITATKELKKSLMRHLFTYGPTQVEEAEQVLLKETEVGLVPRHWNVVRLGDISRIRYGLGQPPECKESGIPMIRATNIKRGRIFREGLLYVNPQSIPRTRDPFLKAGDIIVVRSGAYTGDVAIVTPEWEGSIAGYDLIVSPSVQTDSGLYAQYLLVVSQLEDDGISAVLWFDKLTTNGLTQIPFTLSLSKGVFACPNPIKFRLTEH